MSTNFDETFREVGYVCDCSCKRFDFDGDPIHFVNSGIFDRKFFHCGTGTIVLIISLITEEDVDEFL